MYNPTKSPAFQQGHQRVYKQMKKWEAEICQLPALTAGYSPLTDPLFLSFLVFLLPGFAFCLHG
jgi:hypothetical protein